MVPSTEKSTESAAVKARLVASGGRLAQEFGLDASLIQPISARDSDLPTRRSLNLSMNTNKLQAALGKTLPGVSEGLSALHADFDSGLRMKLLSLTS